MASDVNSKLLEKFYDALNDRRFNPRLFGHHIALDGGCQMNVQVMQIVVGYLEATRNDYLFGIDKSGLGDLSEIANQMLEAYKKGGGI